MKINDILLQQTAKKSSATSRQSSGTNFQDILEGQIRNAGGVDNASGTARTEQSQAVSASLRVEGLGLTESAINTLESYGAALGNTSLNSADLEPFVSALEEETAALLSCREQLPLEDPLAKLLDRVATATYLESAKYRRGDYTS